MLCPSCKKEIPEKTVVCPSCGQPTSAGAEAGPAPRTRETARAKRGPYALSSLLCGLFSVLLCVVLFPNIFAKGEWILLVVPLGLGLAAVALGHKAHRGIRRSGAQLKGSGLAVTGVVLGAVGLLLIGPFFYLGRQVRLYMQPGEVSPVGSLRQYVTACISYSNTHPERGFPANLSVLGPADDGLLDTVLAPPGGVNTATKSGYKFTYTPGQPDRQGRITGFTSSARPVKYEKTGKRSFFADETGVIRFTTEDRAATAHDQPLS